MWAQGPEYRYLSPIEKLGMATHFQPQRWGLKMEDLWIFWPTNISETSCFKFSKKPLLENQGVKVIDINSGILHTRTRVSTHPTALTPSLRSRRKNAERWILDDASGSNLYIQICTMLSTAHYSLIYIMCVCEIIEQWDAVGRQMILNIWTENPSKCTSLTQISMWILSWIHLNLPCNVKFILFHSTYVDIM